MPAAPATPSAPYALGLLAELERAASRPEPPAGDPATAGAGAELASVQQEALARGRAVATLRGQIGTAARAVAEANAQQAELMPRIARMAARAQTLAEQQRLADAEQARALRRQRAELDVQRQDLQHQLDVQASRAAQAREALLARRTEHDAEAALEHAVRQRQAALQAQLPTAQAQLQRLELQLGLEHARRVANVAGEPAERLAARWSARVRPICADVLALHQALAAGRFAEAEAQALVGGRTPLCAEAIWGLIALGDDAAALALYDASCGQHAVMHQIFHVFRAHVGGLWVSGAHGPLAEVLRLHRLGQGLRGAMADAMWALLARDTEAFERALVQVVQLDWRTWQRSEAPALGLVSLVGLGLARLGRERGLRVPEGLGPTMPLP